MQLRGVIPPMVTPTTGRSGTVDTDRVRSFTDFLVDGGVHGLFPCGSIGEFTSLTREERAAVIEAVVEAADDRPVIAGCGGTAVPTVRDRLAEAADAGADAGVIVTPYYLTTTDDGMIDFYDAVAENSPLPLVLYNIPQLTKHSLSVETVRDLAHRDEFIGIKDSSGDITFVNELIGETPEDFAVLPGVSSLQVASLDSGADGVVSGVANVFPDVVSRIHEAHLDGDRDGAVQLLNGVCNPLVGGLADLPTASALKYLVGLVDEDVGPPLPPLPRLTDDQRGRLKERYERAREAVEIGAPG